MTKTSRPIFVLTNDKDEFKAFKKSALNSELYPKFTLLSSAKQLWGLEERVKPIVVFKLPSAAKWKNYTSILTYLNMRCKNFNVYDEAHNDIFSKKTAPVPTGKAK